MSAIKPGGVGRVVTCLCLLVFMTGCSAPQTPAAGAASLSAAEVSPSGVAATVHESKKETGVRVSPWVISSNPQLRELTVAIHVQPPTSLAASYRALAQRYKSLRHLLLTHAEGGFGSGFVIVRGQAGPRTGRIYLVTNQHVMGLAESARVQFGGQSETMEASVIYVDENYDLAVLVLEDEEQEIPVSAGFGFASDPAHDQDIVVAAGYPGIAGEPSYQVTRGYVSNEAVLLPTDDKEQWHLQHTAPIDPGSSGGPLLNEAGQVVGMNTLKVYGREGVGLAVPASVIEGALQSVGSQGQRKDALAALAQDACESLLATVKGDGEKSIERSIAAALLAKEGPRSLGWLATDDDSWGRRFSDSPEEVLLHALALRLRETLEERASENGRRCIPIEAATDTSFSFRLGKEGPPLKWSWEQARFKLAAVDLLPPRPGTFLSPATQRKGKWKPSL